MEEKDFFMRCKKCGNKDLIPVAVGFDVVYYCDECGKEYTKEQVQEDG